MNIALSIKVGITRKGIKQKDVAAKVGQSPQVISYWATGERQPNVKGIEALAAAFGVPVSEFIKWGE